MERQLRSPLRISSIWAMNAFPAGTRVFYWLADGRTMYGTVEGSSRLDDGSQALVIREDGTGRTITLPATAVNRVT